MKTAVFVPFFYVNAKYNYLLPFPVFCCIIKPAGGTGRREESKTGAKAMKNILNLFWTFAKMGAVCFGGGYAMLPLLERELVTKRGWTTQEEIVDYFAIGQCTPGIIAVNVSTFIGCKRGGVAGAIAATTGMVFFPVIIIMIIAGLLRNYAENPYVQRALGGIAVCVCVLIIDAITKLWKRSVTNGLGYVIFAAVLLLSLATDISSGIFILCAGIMGIVYGNLNKAKEVKK